jgi:hypothetical protein
VSVGRPGVVKSAVAAFALGGALHTAYRVFPNDSNVGRTSVDAGRKSCSVAGLDGSGSVILRRRAKRETLIALAGRLPLCGVALEASCGAHHLGRVFASQGHVDCRWREAVARHSQVNRFYFDSALPQPPLSPAQLECFC